MPNAPVSLSNIHSFPTVHVIAFRHVQAAIWHGHPVPSNTTVPPLSVALCLFSCVFVVSYSGSSITLETYITPNVHKLSHMIICNRSLFSCPEITPCIRSNFN